MCGRISKIEILLNSAAQNKKKNTMQIHNYYNDLLLSIRTLFDNKIFKNNFIKYYSFNIANQSFELLQRDYKPNRNLPAAIINLYSDLYTFGERPTNILHQNIENINQIPILYDSINKQVVYLQEEHLTTSLVININCESQFQAKEIEFYIKRYLPLNKYIQLYTYTSFLEIDPLFLLDLNMNFNNYPINNLFTKLNKQLGIVEYCYSVTYKPLLNLTSIDTAISNPTQPTFQVNLNLELLNNYPLYLVYPSTYNEIQKINIDFSRFGHEFISENPMHSFHKINDDLKLTQPSKIPLRNLLIHELDDPTIIKIQFNKDDFIISKDLSFNIFDINNKIYPNITPKELNTEENSITFTVLNNNMIPSITQPIIVQFLKDTLE